MGKYSEIYRGKKERIKSIALKAKKESSDDETLTSGSDDEEYAMAVRNFKFFFRRRLNLLGNQEKKRSHSDKGMRRAVRVTGNILDAVIQIISLEIVQNHLTTKIKRPSLKVLGAIAKMTPKTKLMMKLVSWLNRQMRVEYHISLSNRWFDNSRTRSENLRKKSKGELPKVPRQVACFRKADYTDSGEWLKNNSPGASVVKAPHNILANEQQHTEQSEPSYDTHLLETIDSNTTPTSTNMCHRGGEIDQDALLKTELLKTKDMVDKEIYNELSKRFLQLEKHCISLEIQIQQKEESFQSNKPSNEQLHKENEHLKQTYKELFDSIKKKRIQNKDNSESLISQINQKSVENADLKAQIQEKNFKTVSLRWILLKGVFIDSTTKVDSEPPNGSNDDITNPYECNQTLYVSAGTSNSSAGLVLHLDDIRWQKRIFMHLNLQDEMNRSFIAQNSYRLERETFSKIYKSCRRILSSTFQLIFQEHKFVKAFTASANSLLSTFSCKSISVTEAEEEAVAREVHATYARIVSESEPEPTQRRQSGIAFRDSFIVSKKRSSDSSKKLKGIQTLIPAKQEATDIMKALKESKKMSKRQPRTGGLNKGTGNILGVPDDSTVVSRVSSEGTRSKPGVPDEEKLILEWEADVDSEHFDRDDNAGDDNEETKPDPEEIYK
ncbi:hypothetical protein Tco_0268415 [Tanacetum coccineum]